MAAFENKAEISDADIRRLDEWFERLERMPVPEGYKVEIVGGCVYLTPQRDTHWLITLGVVRALEDRFGTNVKVFSDVRIDFPGHQNGFCPDIALLKDSAKTDDTGHWRYKDVEFVAEVITEGTAANDYGRKRIAYAQAEVPLYLIADPYQGRCHVYTDPEDGDYAEPRKADFGTDIDLTGTVVDLVLKTDEFPRD